MSQNDVLAVMFVALFFGIGLMLVQTPQTQALKTAIEGVFEVAMKLIGLVIQLAPIALFCFMFNLAAHFGWDLIVRLSAYVGVRSEVRRVGKEGVRMCRSRWSSYHFKKKAVYF